ncbi:MAG: ABC-2 family transporter protein, partial [Fimbriimonas ginsengisoli]|nr:ABC-2 family transporter protein [Fimbriimonas ginsengisoli]
SHMMWDIAMEIKEGQFTLALVRPISFFQFTFMRNLAWRFLRLVLFTPIFGVLVWMYHPFLLNVHLHLGWEFWVAVLLGHLVSISFVLMMSMLALFVQEAQSIFELYYVPMLFLSGQLFPVSVMPGWVRSIVPFFPFYFTTGAPTEILVGRVSGDAAIHVIAMQLMWIGIAVVVGKVLWRYGLRQYTAVGM